MEQKELNIFELALMDQRNQALNEAAYWRAEATKAQAELAALKKPDLVPVVPVEPPK